MDPIRHRGHHWTGGCRSSHSVQAAWGLTKIRKSILFGIVALALFLLAFADAYANGLSQPSGYVTTVTQTIVTTVNGQVQTLTITGTFTETRLLVQTVTQTDTVTQTVTETVGAQTITQTVTQVVTHTETVTVPNNPSPVNAPPVGSCTSNQVGRCNFWITVAGQNSVEALADGSLYGCGSGVCSNPTGQVTIGSTLTAWIDGSNEARSVIGVWNINGLSVTGNTVNIIAPATDLRIAVDTGAKPAQLDLRSSNYPLPLLFKYWDLIFVGASIISGGIALVYFKLGD